MPPRRDARSPPRVRPEHHQAEEIRTIKDKLDKLEKKLLKDKHDELMKKLQSKKNQQNTWKALRNQSLCYGIGYSAIPVLYAIPYVRNFSSFLDLCLHFCYYSLTSLWPAAICHVVERCLGRWQKQKKAGEIPPLVALVRDGSDAQKEEAASALCDLAENDDDREAIIPPLVALVRDGTDAQKEHAAAALQRLPVDADDKITIAQAGGIPPLVALIRDGNDAQKQSAAGALQKIARPSGYRTSSISHVQNIARDNQVAIAKAGGIPPLVALIRDGTNAQKERAAGALRNLSFNADSKVAIAKAKHAAGM